MDDLTVGDVLDRNEQHLWLLLAEHLKPRSQSWKGREYMERLSLLEILPREELVERVVQQFVDGDLDEFHRMAADRQGIDWESVIASAAGQLAALPLETLIEKARPVILAGYRERIGINNPCNQDTHPELHKCDEVRCITVAIGLKMLQGACTGMDLQEKESLVWTAGDAVLQHCHGEIIRACDEVLGLWGQCDWEELTRRGLITPEECAELQRDHLRDSRQ